MNHKKNVLTIAGSDSSGGAGIQADLKTFEALKVYGASVISAVTSQNTQGVQSVYNLPPAVFESQLQAAFTDIHFSAIKIGMIKSVEHINLLAELLKTFCASNIVLDPVMISSSGFRLQDETATQAMVDKLFPLTTLVTPNIPEAAALLNCTPTWVHQHPAESCSRLLQNFALNAVLLKGGHTEEAYCLDTLALTDSASGNLQIIDYRYPKQAQKNTHGTGCTLASAVAAYLALDYDLASAVDFAGQYLQQALKNADRLKVGKGIGPLNHQDASQRL